MKLQKYKRRIKGKTYYQYLLTVSPNLVKALKLEGKNFGWEINEKGHLELVEETKKRGVNEKVIDLDLQVVVFRLGDGVFGAEISQVEEIIKMPEITRMPSAPEFVEGIINLRGDVMTIMDLRKKLGLSVTETSEETRIIIAETSGYTLGLIVDSVREVITLKDKDIDAASSAKVKYDSDFVRGVAKLPDGLLILLDLTKMLSEKELNRIKAMSD